MKYIVSALIASSVSVASWAMPPEKVDAWTEDLRVYSEELIANHIDPFHTLTEERFRSDLSAIIAELPRLNEDETIARLMRLHHAVGDGHTSIPLWGYGYRRFPIDVELVGGEILVTGVRREDAARLGGIVTSVDGGSVGYVIDALSEVVPFVENEGSQAIRLASYFSVAELMSAIGTIDSADSIRLEIETGGDTHSLVLPAVSGDDYGAQVVQRLDYRRDLSETEIAAGTDGLAFVFFPDRSLGYIRYDSYPAAEDMDHFASQVVEIMEQEGGRHLAIDFRNNYGGDFFTGLRLAHQLNLLDGVDWQEGVYVLTSGLTFSAAMSNSAQYSDILNARRVGEATGASPCGYQDMGSFNLPNSNLLVTYSKRRFCFAEAVDEALQPDHPVPVTAEHWRQGYDAALDWVMRDIDERMARDGAPLSEIRD